MSQSNVAEKVSSYYSVKALVLEYYHSKRSNPSFYLEEMLEYVKDRYGEGVSLQTPYRRMHELYQEGLLDYDVEKSRFTFHYKRKG